jgi:4-hydroxybutyrate CoA-transferase
MHAEFLLLRGDVDFVPARYFDTVSLFAAGGPWAPDAVLVHAAPADRGGYLSLGVSVSYLLPAARRAPLVIAQVNPRMPRTLGNAFLHRSQVDLWTPVEDLLLEYPPTPVGDVERRIGTWRPVPDGATLQVAGLDPQAVMEALAGKKDLGVHSLLVEHMLPLVRSGVITNARKRLHPGRMDVGEIMGTAALFEWSHENPLVNMEPSDVVHDPEVVGALGDFVSVNSALEVDLLGQVNAESVDGRQVTGIGGQFDFVLGAARAEGGRSVIALPATASRGTVSRIVARLAAGARVTTPRFLADYVVTEYGVAALRGKATPGARGSCSASPTRRSGNVSSARSSLELVDLGEDLLILREAKRDLVVVDHLVVGLDGEDAPDAFAQLGLDTVLALDRGLQTGGLGEIVSLAAVRDPDVHRIPPLRQLCAGLSRMIRTPAGPVK